MGITREDRCANQGKSLVCVQAKTGRATRRSRGLTAPRANGLVLGFSSKNPLRKTSVMALKIRLTKVGSVHQPLYRVVVAEARSRRDGAATENLGTYRPGDKGNPININLERVDYWLSKGAKPTNTMHSMIKKA